MQEKIVNKNGFDIKVKVNDGLLRRVVMAKRIDNVSKSCASFSCAMNNFITTTLKNPLVK